MILKHIAFPVRDLDSSVEFYVKFFGFKTVGKWERDGISAIQLKDENDFMLELTFSPKAKLFSKERPETQHLGFVVEDLKTNIEYFKQEDVKIIQEIRPGITVKRFAFISDPNGLPIELVELK
jgi:glyoxylase I family protein